MLRTGRNAVFILILVSFGCAVTGEVRPNIENREDFKSYILKNKKKHIYEKYSSGLDYLDSVKALTDMAALCLAVTVKSITQDGDQTIKKGITYMPTMKFRQGETTLFTVRMTHNPKKVGEPEGGFYALAVDIRENKEKKAELDIYAMVGSRRDISDTVVKFIKDWSSAESGDCPELM